jgi:pimeloyl-ACP methyl ester carboxylesterase
MDPSAARWLRRLASFSRFVIYDNRGVGLSDPVPTRAGAPVRLESRGLHELKGVPGSWEIFAAGS